MTGNKISLEEGRREIDELDSGLVELLALRKDAVRRLVANKVSEVLVLMILNVRECSFQELEV